MSTATDRLHQAALRLFAERGVTQLTVSELADAAGVARGTVYNNLKNVESLFEDVAAQLMSEMQGRIAKSLSETTDLPQALADGIRFFVRRAHEEPNWGRFLVRFGATTPTLRGLLGGAPAVLLQKGVEQKRFHLRPDQLVSVVGAISGSVLAAMALVLEGHRTWRDAGADTAEFCLRALGVPVEQARSHATAALPLLAAAA